MPLYQLCGDNLDKNVKSQYFRSNARNTQSLHYFHYYAVKDRVDFSCLEEMPVQSLQSDLRLVAKSLLPSATDDAEMKRNICILMSRVLFNNVPCFQTTFDGTVNWHIEHQFYKEMCLVSEVVSHV